MMDLDLLAKQVFTTGSVPPLGYSDGTFHTYDENGQPIPLPPDQEAALVALQASGLHYKTMEQYQAEYPTASLARQVEILAIHLGFMPREASTDATPKV